MIKGLLRLQLIDKDRSMVLSIESVDSLLIHYRWTRYYVFVLTGYITKL